MFIIIVGCGTVGHHLTRALISAGHEVLAIERDSSRHSIIIDDLGSVAVNGDGTEVAVLEAAGAGRADAEVLIAVTGQDEDNLLACQLAKYKFNIPKTIARVSNPENEGFFKNLDVDVVVSHTNMILTHVEGELPGHPLVHLLQLQGAKRHLVGIHIPPDADVVGKPLELVDLPADTLISLLVNAAGEARLPTDGEKLQANDDVVAVTTPSSEEELLETLTRVA